MQPLQNCTGPTIRIGREILCLPYAGFLSCYLPNFSKTELGFFVVQNRVILQIV